MAELVTLAQAKAHLRLTGTTEHDTDIELKLEEATAMAVSYLKNYIGDTDERTARYAVIDAWTVETVPLEARSGILRILGHLWEIRGGEEPNRAEKLEHGDLPANATMFLKRLRDPALA